MEGSQPVPSVHCGTPLTDLAEKNLPRNGMTTGISTLFLLKMTIKKYLLPVYKSTIDHEVAVFLRNNTGLTKISVGPGTPERACQSPQGLPVLPPHAGEERFPRFWPGFVCFWQRPLKAS